MQEMQACEFRPRMLSWICANLSRWIMNAMVKTERTRANAVAPLCYCVTFGWAPRSHGEEEEQEEVEGAGSHLVSGSIWRSACHRWASRGKKREAHVTTDCGEPSRCIRAPAGACCRNFIWKNKTKRRFKSDTSTTWRCLFFFQRSNSPRNRKCGPCFLSLTLMDCQVYVLESTNHFWSFKASKM